MGIDLIVNFKQPYFSTSPSEFWKRWHISLSTWLRDYVYISLGGNRKKFSRILWINYYNVTWWSLARSYWNFIFSAIHGLINTFKILINIGLLKENLKNILPKILMFYSLVLLHGYISHRKHTSAILFLKKLIFWFEGILGDFFFSNYVVTYCHWLSRI